MRIDRQNRGQSNTHGLRQPTAATSGGLKKLFGRTDVRDLRMYVRMYVHSSPSRGENRSPESGVPQKACSFLPHRGRLYSPPCWRSLEDGTKSQPAPNGCCSFGWVQNTTLYMKHLMKGFCSTRYHTYSVYSNVFLGETRTRVGRVPSWPSNSVTYYKGNDQGQPCFVAEPTTITGEGLGSEASAKTAATRRPVKPSVDEHNNIAPLCLPSAKHCNKEAAAAVYSFSYQVWACRV